MPKQLALSVLIELPDDLFEGSVLIARIQPAWDALLAEIGQTGQKVETKVDTMDVRAKLAANGTGGKRGRKPKLPTFLLEQETVSSKPALLDVDADGRLHARARTSPGVVEKEEGGA